MNANPRPPFPPQPISEPGLESRMDPEPRYQAGTYQPAGKLTGKVALITGGDSGIGRAVALMFAREGADIALIYLAEVESDARAIGEEIEAHGRIVLQIPGDVSDPEFCRSAVDRVITRFDRLNILINNAAYQKHRDGLEDIAPAYVFFASNADSSYITGHVLPQLGGDTIGS